MTESPDELTDVVTRQIALRQTQLTQLRLFYHEHFPSPRALVAYGPKDVQKTETIEYHLASQGIEYVTVNCEECLSQRHLLVKAFARCVQKVGLEDDLDRFDKVDSINAFASNLKKILQGRKQKFVLVIAGVDQQKGTTPTLLPALARLGDLVPQLHVIFTSSSLRPLPLHKPGVPYVHFPPYTRIEQIRLLIREGPPSVSASILPSIVHKPSAEKLKQIYTPFVTTIYDTLVAPTTSSLSRFRRVCHRLWPSFIWPLIVAETPHARGENIDWDFPRLLSKNRRLFQAEGEEALQDHLLSSDKQAWTWEELAVRHEEAQKMSLPMEAESETRLNGADSSTMLLTSSRRGGFQPVQPPTAHIKLEPETALPPLLKFLPTLILVAAYLASHTHAKHDIVLFSRLSTASSTSRRKRKYLARSRSGGISKTPTKSPSKIRTIDDDENGGDEMTETPSKRKLSTKEIGDVEGQRTPKKERADRSMRAIFEKTSSIARAFTVERLIAMLRAIHPHGLPNNRGIADRIYVELAELERLRLVVRENATRDLIGSLKRGGGGGLDAEDLLEEKWKCVVSREFVVNAGKHYSTGLEGWEIVD